LGITGFALIERVQAALHCGNLNEAHEAMDQLAERTSAANTEWALGVQAWCRATLAPGADAERLYREAIERLRQTRINVHLGRAQLGFGEWLRRQKRRSEARDVLREAHKLFEGAGALAYADRARRELLATGEVARARTPELVDALTPQESQVARLARGGMSNPEIGAQLFISPRTVQYHLRKVFQKLGITSRNQLHRLSGTVLGAGESSFEAW
jgi:ATP/maltotriose-dependent transcriptional regulator MalT